MYNDKNNKLYLWSSFQTQLKDALQGKNFEFKAKIGNI